MATGTATLRECREVYSAIDILDMVEALEWLAELREPEGVR